MFAPPCSFREFLPMDCPGNRISQPDRRVRKSIAQTFWVKHLVSAWPGTHPRDVSTRSRSLRSLTLAQHDRFKTAWALGQVSRRFSLHGSRKIAVVCGVEIV